MISFLAFGFPVAPGCLLSNIKMNDSPALGRVTLERRVGRYHSVLQPKPLGPSLCNPHKAMFDFHCSRVVRVNLLFSKKVLFRYGQQATTME